MKSVIAYMADNGVAANLLMALLLVSGAISMLSLTQQVFPEIRLGQIEVFVEYRGASPEEVEQSIIEPIEEQIEAVEGIRQITATASEGIGIVTAELQQGADPNQKLDEIQSRIDRITNFPARAEEPEVRELTNRRRAIEIALYGDVPEATLKELANRVESELSMKEDISFVQTSGVRTYEISIEVPRDTLRAYDLSLPEIARIIGRNSIDLPGGDIDTGESQILLRVEGEKLTGDQYRDIVVIASEDGAQVTLGQIAQIRDGFRDTGLITRYNGQPAALVRVFRTGDEQVLSIDATVQDYLERLEGDLPTGIRADIWQNEADQLRKRLDLLLTNAALGALLVIAVLALFLQLRVAFWVSIGIVISFVGAFTLMNLFGVTINQMSLFGFILAIGIVVDDAIVVGENIAAESEGGRKGIDAAVEGASRVALPVTFAIATTVIAFIPLLFLPGSTGKFLVPIPAVVIFVLLLSLAESLLVLPHHLSDLKTENKLPKNRLLRALKRGKTRFENGLQTFINGPLDRAVRFCVNRTLVVLTTAFIVMVLTITLFAAGYIKFVFFPAIEGQYVTAQFGMPVGTTKNVTLDFAERLDAAGRRTADRLVEQAAGNGDGTKQNAAETGEDSGPVSGPFSGPFSGPGAAILEAVYTTVGRLPQDGGPEGGGTQITSATNGAVRFKLTDPSSREIGAAAFEDAWRQQVGPAPETDYVSFSASLVDVGNPVSVELSHPNSAVLRTAVEDLKEALRQIEGVFDIYDTEDQGQRELELDLLDRARVFGLTLQDLADQIRAAYFGAEALRIQRDEEEVRVYVRLPEIERDSLADFEDYRIRTPDGAAIPLSEVATIRYGTGPSSIDRRNGRRIITVNGDVREGVTTGQDVNNRLTAEILPDLQQRFPELTYDFGGEQREQQQTLPSLMRNFGLALFAIYALLAVSFRSYFQPFVILAIVPFGLIGATIGHLLLGLNVTFLSVFGLVGLSGVVINDALIMLDFINARRLKGDSMRDAIIAGAKARFRPILLTSVTTFLGIAPIMFSQAVQAQFLVPLATSIAFGIFFATLIQMLLLPALVQTHYDMAQWWGRLVRRRRVQVVHNAPGGGAS